MPLGQKYIVAKGVGGLGNRILGTMTALHYARISGRRLIVDWSDGFYAPPGVNAFPRLFDCPANHPLDALPETGSIYPGLWSGRLGDSVHDFHVKRGIKSLPRLSIDVARSDYDEDVVMLCACNQLLYQMNHYYTGDFSYFRSMNDKSILNRILREDMTLNRDIMTEVESVVTAKFEPDNIGVHVRFTDVRVSLDQIDRALERRLAGKRQSQIFLATDCQDVETDFKRRFDNVLTVDKWFPAPGQKLHQNSTACPDLVQNGVEALRDLYLLSRCGSVIYSSRSTFGVVASVLNGTEGCYDIERSMKDRVKRMTWGLLRASRPLRRRFRLTKSALRKVYAFKAPKAH